MKNTDFSNFLVKISFYIQGYILLDWLSSSLRSSYHIKIVGFDEQVLLHAHLTFPVEVLYCSIYNSSR